MAQDLSKRGKVGDVYRGGSYKKASKAGYKTAGLSAAQMKKATTLKGKKISAGQMKKAGELKSISSTRWEKGKGVVGPGGKAFTGSVQLASGKTASYVKGRRIGVGPAKKAAPAKRTTGNPPANPPADPPSGGTRSLGSYTKAQRTIQKNIKKRQSATPPKFRTVSKSPRSKKTATDIWSEKFNTWYRGKVD